MSAPFRGQADQLVGPYRLVKPLGQGGFSEVWRAQRGAGPHVALKILLHPEHVAQLRQEASALAVVRGPGIVPVHDVALEHDPPYMALGLLEGGDLRSRLQGSIWTAPVLNLHDPANRRLPPLEAIGIFEKLLAILARVHQDGVVHGDLKPENLLFDAAGTLTVGDFGLSRRISQRSASLSVSLSLDDARIAGTLDYMAPEQRAGERPTTRSDVYAAGVILYEMLVGERPQGRFRMPCRVDRRIPPVVDRVVACALAEDARNRFPDAGAMLRWHRAGMASDWAELAVAFENVDRALLWRGEVLRFIAVLFVAGVLVAGASTLALSDLGLRDATRDRALGGAVGFALGLAIFLGGLRWWSRRREERFERMRATVEEQIGHEGAHGKRRKPLQSQARGCWKLAFLLLLLLGAAALPVLVAWSTASRRQKEVNRSFGRWVSHAGTITDERGAPVPRVTVILDGYVRTTTDERGRFAFGEVERGAHIVWATDGRLVSDRSWCVDLAADFEQRVDYKMKLVPAGTIRGRVRAGAGPVSLLPGARHVAVDEEGGFVISPLTPGRYAVCVGRKLHLLTVRPGEEAALDLSGE